MFNEWRKIPVVRLVLPFVLGILLQIYFPLSLDYIFLSGGFALLLLVILLVWRVFLHYSKYLFNLCLHILLVALGMALTHVKTEAIHPLHYSQVEQIELVDAVVNSSPENGENTYKTTVNVRAVHAEGKVRKTRGELLLYVSNKTELFWEKGDRILITRSPQEIEAPANPGEFDYQQFMYYRGITHRIFLRDPSQAVLLERGFESDWLDPYRDIREGFVEVLSDAISNRDAFAVSSALILGQKEYLSPQIRSAYAGTGAMHVLAVSGLHVGIIYLILMAGFKYLGDSKTALWLRLSIVLLVLWSYAVITGLSPSVVRASTMFSAVAFAQNLGRRTNIFNTLATAALVMLCFDPYLLLNVGFQLSFSAVLAIVLLQPKIYALLAFEGVIWDKIWQLTSVSIAAQIGTFPLGIFYFHQFPNYFMLTNLVVIPGAFVILSVGIALITTSWIPIIYEVLGNLLNLLVVAMNGAVRWIESLPKALSSGLYLSNLEVVVLYLLMAFGIAFIYSSRVKILTGALVCALVFLGVFSYRVYENNSRRTIIVNKVSNQFSLNLIDGNQNILVADSVFLHDTNRQGYHLASHWFERGHGEPVKIDLAADSIFSQGGFFKQGNFICFHGYRLRIISDEQDGSSLSVPMPETDLLVVAGKAKVDTSLRCRMIAVSPAYRYRTLCCDSIDQPVYDVRENGALVVDLKNNPDLDHSLVAGF